jgi:hypothetical protein
VETLRSYNGCSGFPAVSICRFLHATARTPERKLPVVRVKQLLTCAFLSIEQVVCLLALSLERGNCCVKLPALKRCIVAFSHCAKRDRHAKLGTDENKK